MQNFYEILGISRTASNKQIKDAFIAKMKIYHPDKHIIDKCTKDEEICAQIGEAYSTLKDAKLRRNYDLNLPPEKIAEKSSYNSNYNQNFNFQNQQQKTQKSANINPKKKKPINSQEYRDKKKSKLTGKDKRDKLALDIALIFFIVILLIMISLIYIN